MKSRYVRVKAPFVFEFQEKEMTEPGAREVLIKVKTCAICATDFHNVKYNYKDFRPVGHEGAGDVVKTGSEVSKFKPGDKVAVLGTVKCGECEYCSGGQARLCRNCVSVWNDKQMLLSDYMILDERTLEKFDDSKIDYKAAALLEPASVAMELVKSSELEKDEPVLVVGLGAIGLMTAQIAVGLGAKVYGAELSTASAALDAAEKSGLERVVHSELESINGICTENKIRKIMITAPPALIPKAVEAIEFGGLITYIGLGQEGREMVTFNINNFLRKKATIRAVYAVPGLYAKEALNALESGIIKPKLLITHNFSLNQIKEAFAVIENNKPDAVKVIVNI